MSKPLVLHLEPALVSPLLEFLDERAHIWNEAARVLAADGADHGWSEKNIAADEASRTSAAFAAAALSLRRQIADA